MKTFGLELYPKTQIIYAPDCATIVFGGVQPKPDEKVYPLQRVFSPEDPPMICVFGFLDVSVWLCPRNVRIHSLASKQENKGCISKCRGRTALYSAFAGYEAKIFIGNLDIS